jgi:predicted GNAT family acetyltransferase
MPETERATFRNGVTDSGRAFEMIENGARAWADYRVQDGRLIIPHVEADPALRGAGAAGRLMEGVIEAARQRGLKIVPLCGYADAWMRRHPETADLRA